MRSQLRLLGSACFIAAALQGCSWDALWGLDAPRPALSDDDTFQVHSQCPPVFVSASSFVVAETTVTLTGKRYKSGLGAHAVPVTVVRGACADLDHNGAAPDASTSTSEPDASTVDGGVSGRWQPLACDGDTQPLDRELADAVELVGMPERGCRQRSPSVLDCNLDGRGEASFGLLARLPDDIPTLGGFVPFCITPLGAGQTELHAVPRNGSARFTVAVVERPAVDDVAPAPDAECAALFDCGAIRPRGRLLAGIVSGDVPAADIRESDFLPANRDLKVRVVLQALSDVATGATAGFLSEDADCPPPAMGATGESSLDLTLEAGSDRTKALFLCADRYGGEYEVVASLEGVVTQDAGMPEDASSSDTSDTFFVRSTPLPLLPLLEGYSAQPSQSGGIVHTKACGVAPVQTRPGEVQVFGDTSVVDDDERIELVCGPQPVPPQPMDEDGGMTSAAEPAPTCEDVSLGWKMGATCSLDTSSL